MIYFNNSEQQLKQFICFCNIYFSSYVITLEILLSIIKGNFKKSNNLLTLLNYSMLKKKLPTEYTLQISLIKSQMRWFGSCNKHLALSSVILFTFMYQVFHLLMKNCKISHTLYHLLVFKYSLLVSIPCAE